MRRTFPIFIVVVFLFCADSVWAQRAKPNKPVEPSAEFIGKPFYWIVAKKEGNQGEGHLFFGVIVENRTEKLLYVGVNFQSYLEDGTKYEGCYGIGGAGASVEILPKERAKVVCSGATVPKNIGSLQITSRIGYVDEHSNNKLAVDIVEQGTFVDDRDFVGKNTVLFAKLRSRYKEDRKIRVVFRFYDENGVQIGGCESRDQEIQPEVMLKVTCQNYYGVGDEPLPKVIHAEIREPMF